MQSELCNEPVNCATSSSDDSEKNILLNEQFVLWNPQNGEFSALKLPSDNDEYINKIKTHEAKPKIKSIICNAGLEPKIRVRTNLVDIVNDSGPLQTSEKEVKTLLLNKNIQNGVNDQTGSNIDVETENTLHKSELQSHCEKTIVENWEYERFECHIPKCKKKFKSHYRVQKHIYQSHKGTAFYKCSICKSLYTCTIKYGLIHIELCSILKHGECTICKSFLKFGCGN